MCINRLGLIVLKRFWKIVVFLVFGEVKSSLVVRNGLNNKLNKDYSTSFSKSAAEISQSSKCLNYRMFKSNFKMEHYLVTLTHNNRRLLARYRCRNHNLPVEIGCHRGIPREQRKCNWCENELGDEFHFIMNCSNLKTFQNQLIKRLFKNLYNLYMYIITLTCIILSLSPPGFICTCLLNNRYYE